jgi:arsenate reductase
VCPVTPGVRRISWSSTTPKNLPLERVREIRDDIDRHVHELLAQLNEQNT